MFIGKQKILEDIYVEETTSANTRKVSILGVLSLNSLINKIFYIKSNIANTGAGTLQINSLTATDIKKVTSAGLVDIASGDIVDGQVCFYTYDGTQFVLLNPLT